MENIKTVNIKIEGEEWNKVIDKALNKALKKAKIDGFRQGHVPKDVFLKKYGIESVYYDAADICVQDAYNKMLEDNSDLEIVAQPDMKVKSMDEKGIEFEFVLTLKPQLKLGKYKGLGIKKEKVSATCEEIDDTIKHMRERYSEETIKEGKVEKGNIAVIDFEGFKDGVAFDGGKGENYSLEIGSNSFIPGFEDQLIGMDKEEEKEINVTFPEDYHAEDLKGAPVTFKVKVHEIKEVKVPELNEDFFDDLALDEVNSEETLREYVKKMIEEKKETEADNKYVDALLEAAAKNIEVDIPSVMIDEEVHRMIHQYEDNLKRQGMNLEMYYKFTNSDEDKLKEQMRSEATNRVTYRLMLEEIAKVEKIEISEEDALKETEELSKRYQMEKDEFLKSFGGIEMVKYDLRMRGALEALKK